MTLARYNNDGRILCSLPRLLIIVPLETANGFNFLYLSKILEFFRLGLTFFWGITKSLVVHTLVSFSVYGIRSSYVYQCVLSVLPKMIPSFCLLFRMILFCSYISRLCCCGTFWRDFDWPLHDTLRNITFLTGRLFLPLFKRPRCMLCYPQVVKVYWKKNINLTNSFRPRRKIHWGTGLFSGS